MKKLILFIIFTISILIYSCNSNSKVRKLNRADDKSTETNEELSVNWSEIDARKTAEVLINQMLNENWYQKALNMKSGELPLILVKDIENTSNSHIDPYVFMKQIQRTLILAKKVKFLSNKIDVLKQERRRQEKYATNETKRIPEKKLETDYMLTGTVTAVTNKKHKNKIKYFWIKLELTNTKTGEIVWIGEKKIKKTMVYIKKSF